MVGFCKAVRKVAVIKDYVGCCETSRSISTECTEDCIRHRLWNIRQYCINGACKWWQPWISIMLYLESARGTAARGKRKREKYQLTMLAGCRKSEVKRGRTTLRRYKPPTFCLVNYSLNRPRRCYYRGCCLLGQVTSMLKTFLSFFSPMQLIKKFTHDHDHNVRSNSKHNASKTMKMEVRMRSILFLILANITFSYQTQAPKKSLIIDTDLYSDVE